MLYVAIICWLVCGVIYSNLYESGFITLSPVSINHELFERCSNVSHSERINPTTACPQFNPYMFSADALLPLVKLVERERWVFREPKTQEGINIEILGISIASVRPSIVIIQVIYSFEIIFGWFLAIFWVLSQRTGTFSEKVSSVSGWLTKT